MDQNNNPNPLSVVPEPKLVDLNQSAKPRVFVSTGSHKKAFILGALVVFLLVGGLITSLFLVQKNQDIRSKAAGNLGSGWPVSPSPSDGATGVELSPTFRWDYETANNSSCNPAGSYVNVYLWNCAAHNDSCLVGFGGRSSDTQSVYEVPSAVMHPYSSLGVLDYGRVIAPLSPNKQYWWYVTPKACGVLHFEENKAWTFTTGSALPPPPPPPSNSASCQMVSADKDLATIKIGDTITFSGWGVVSADGDKIDKINFIILKDGQPLTGGNTTIDASRDATKDSGTLKAYKANQTFKVTDPGKYDIRIRAHWLKADGSGEWKE